MAACRTIPALPVARTLAQLEHATLHLIHVGTQLPDPRQTLEELGLTGEHLHGVVLDQVLGDPGEGIANCPQFARAADRDADSGRRPILSCRSVRVGGSSTGSAPARILLVNPNRGEEAWEIRRIVLAHDGTPTSDFAIPITADLARRAGADVIALHVAARIASHPANREACRRRVMWISHNTSGQGWAGEFVERMMALGASPSAVNFKLLVSGGQPGSEIAQFTHNHNADLVVVAWHGRWQEQRTGAVKAVVRRARCPVLLIYTPGRPEAGKL